MKQKRISVEQARVYFFKLDEHYLSRPVFIEIDEKQVIKNYEKGFLTNLMKIWMTCLDYKG